MKKLATSIAVLILPVLSLAQENSAEPKRSNVETPFQVRDNAEDPITARLSVTKNETKLTSPINIYGEPRSEKAQIEDLAATILSLQKAVRDLQSGGLKIQSGSVSITDRNTSFSASRSGQIDVKVSGLSIPPGAKIFFSITGTGRIDQVYCTAAILQPDGFQFGVLSTQGTKDQSKVRTWIKDGRIDYLIVPDSQ